MSSKSMSLKSRINNYAKSNNIAAQVVLQNYMFERFLERLSVSEYKDKFVIKGGMLIAAIVGLDTRSTMDLDTTLRNLPLTEKQIEETIKSICNIQLDDDVKFEYISIIPIRKDDRYGGYSVRIDATYDTITTPLSIDVSTGDVITPNPIQYEFSGVFEEDLKIKLWGYNIETVIAEKLETILARGVLNTRPRDFYDIYILTNTQAYDVDVLKSAFVATAEHRNTLDKISNPKEIIEQLSNSNDIKNMWSKYQSKFSYAKEISFDQIINSVSKITDKII